MPLRTAYIPYQEIESPQALSKHNEYMYIETKCYQFNSYDNVHFNPGGSNITDIPT